MKTSNNYQLLPAKTAQKVLKILDRNWKFFFRTIEVWKDDKSKFNGKPKLPGYKPKKGEFILVFTNQQVKLKDDILLFPQKVRFKLKTRLPDTTDLREVRIISKGIGYVVGIVYKKEANPKPLNTDNIIAIDLGVRNLITTVKNNGLKPFVIKGGAVNPMNQYYNKERASIQSNYALQGIKTGKTMLRILSPFHSTS